MNALCRRCFPLTAEPFRADAGYRELLPSALLRPYIRCFWASEGGLAPKLVVPDLCADLIFERDSVRFCGVSDAPFCSVGSGAPLFAIRFYCWAVPFFTKLPPAKTANGFLAGEEVFPDVLLLQRELAEAASLADRAALAEVWLGRIIDEQQKNLPALSAIFQILENQGRLSAAEVACREAVSLRTLERYVRAGTGLTPKMFSELVRYQLLWQGLLAGRSVQDMVVQFGFSDQSHLLREFKRFHTLTLPSALLFARVAGYPIG